MFESNMLNARQPVKLHFAYYICIFFLFYLCYVPAYADISARALLMTKRAAKVDALRNLAEKVYGLRIDSQTYVSNFILHSDVTKSRLSVAIQGAEEVDVRYHDDGSVEVTVEIKLGTVESILGQLIQYDQEVVEAVGYGVVGGNRHPPPEPSSQVYTNPTNMMSATGYGLAPTTPNLSQVERDLFGFRAAKNDALRNLAEKISGIRVQSETTVKDFVTQRDDVKIAVSTVLRGAIVVSEKRLADSRYEVTLKTNVEPLQALLNLP